MAKDNNQPTLTEEQINAVAELYNSGKFSETIAKIKALNEDYPNVPLLFNILGACYQAQGFLEDSAQMFETATKIKPDYAEAYFNLGVVFKADEKLDEAIESYKKAIYLVPNYAAAHNNLGNIYKDINQIDDAMKSYESAIAIKPDYFEAHHNLSTVKKFTKGDNQIEQIKSHLLDNELDVQSQIYLYFTMAKIFEDLGDQKQQCNFLKEGSKLKKQQAIYNPDQSFKLLSSLKVLFQAQNPITDNPSYEVSKKHPIFIIGMPCSGMSLLEQIITNHNDVDTLGESKILSKLVPPIINNKSTEKLVSKQMFLSIRENYFGYLESLSKPQSFITDRMPGNFRYVGFILSAFPEAKIVHVKRDARETCWLIYKRLFSDIGYSWSYSFDDLVKYYSFYSKLMSFWSELYPNQIYDINLEDLIINQEEETRKLLEYCELDWDKNCLTLNSYKDVSETLSSEKLPEMMYQVDSATWKNYEPHIKPLITGLESI